MDESTIHGLKEIIADTVSISKNDSFRGEIILGRDYLSVQKFVPFLFIEGKLLEAENADLRRIKNFWMKATDLFSLGDIVKALYICTNKKYYSKVGEVKEPILSLFLFHAFLDEMKKLLKLGLNRTYKRTYGTLKTIRGRIDFEKEPLLFSTQCVIPQHWHKPTYNTHINCMLKHIVEFFMRFMESSWDLRVINNLLDEYQIEPQENFIELEYIPYGYENLYPIIRAFFMLKLSIEGEQRGIHPSIFIDENLLFEKLIESIAKEEFNAAVQKRKQVGRVQPGTKAVCINPDLLFPDVVVDIKNKEPEDNLYNERDVYQVYSYAKMLGKRQAGLIYRGRYEPITLKFKDIKVKISYVHLDYGDIYHTRESIVRNLRYLIL